MSEQARDDAPRGRAWLLWLGAVFVLALGVRLVFTAQYEARHPQADRPVIDEDAYERWALDIAGGDWIGDEIFFQEPLYPYWLGAVYSLSGPEVATRRTAARRVQAVLGAVSAVLAALLAARLVSRRAGLVAGFAFALYRPAIWMGALLLKPNLFVPLLMVFALALVWTRDAGDASPGARLGRWALVGVLAGLGVLLRGNMLLLAPLFVLWPVARAVLERRAWRAELPAAGCALLGIALVLGPVALRNRAVGGRLVLSTSGAGTNVYGGNNAENPYGLATEFPWVRGIPDHEAGDWQHEAERRLGRELDPTEVSGYWLGQTLDSMVADPLSHLSIFWNKLRLTLGRYEVPDNHFIEWDARRVPFLQAPLPGFALWGTLGIAGLLLALVAHLRGRERADGATVEVAALFVLYLGTIVATVTSERVRLPLVGLLSPFAAAFALALLRPRGRGPTLVACLGIAALAVFAPVLPAEKRAQDFDERDYNLAVGWVEDPSRDVQVRDLVATLEARHPRSPRVQVLAADLAFRDARRVLETPGLSQAEQLRAQASIEDALRRLELASQSSRPRERYQASLLGGAIQQFLGRWGHAARLYAAAREFDPSDRDLRRRLAVVTAEQAVTLDDPALRRAGLERALEILGDLLAEERDPELETLVGKLRDAL